MPISTFKVDDLRKKLLSRTQHEVAQKLSSPDTNVVRALQTAKSLESVYNLLAEQTFDWYALHFPEFRIHFRDMAQGLQLIAALGTRDNFSKEAVGKIIQDEYLVSKLVDSAKSSMGGVSDAPSLKMVQRSAKLALSVKEELSFLQGHIIHQMRAIAPNFSELATPIIAAQLLAKAGSMSRLAELPASALQVMGAEEALFSHIKSGTKPPKHGYLFNHPYLKTLSKKGRGKMARALAGKLAICVRTDVFGKSRVVDEYKPKLEALSKKLSKMKDSSSKPYASR